MFHDIFQVKLGFPHGYPVMDKVFSFVTLLKSVFDLNKR